jgi:NitT/TauT family transport system substrate-binding protein
MMRIAVTIFLFLFLTSCHDTLTTVQVGTTPFFGEAAFYVAQSNAFFEDQGLEVISHSNSAGKESLKQLYDGSLDIAHVAELPIAFALAGSKQYPASAMNPKIFADMIHSSNIQKIIARTDRGIQSPEDLINKRIGAYGGTTSEFFLDTFLLEHNIPDSTVEKVDIDISEHLRAIQNGDVDAVVSWEPNASQILVDLQDKATVLNTMLDHSTLWLAVSSESFIKQNPEIITAYLRAIKQAQAYINRHPREVQKLLATKTNTSQQIIERLWSSIEYELSMGERMLLLIEDQQRWLREKGYIEDRSVPSDVKASLYFDALEEVHPEGITIIQ